MSEAKSATVNFDTGLYSEAIYMQSPNKNDRPGGAGIELLVVHNISLPPGRYGGPWISDLFMNRLDPNAHPYFEAIADNPVSAHALIRRDGSVLQFVPFHERAWHAGRSSYCGREACNDFSIGIEFEGDDFHPFTVTQYSAAHKLVSALVECYPAMSVDRIVGHSDIAPGRKTDPGPYFNWDYFRAGLLNIV